jgi:hypothetical protein
VINTTGLLIFRFLIHVSAGETRIIPPGS